MAFTRDWSESTPAGTDQANTIDDSMRNFKVDISDRIKSMIYGFTAGENTLTASFKEIIVYEQSAPAQPSAGYGKLYGKAASGKCELHWQDEDGNEKQITSAGALLLAAGDYVADSIDENDIQLSNDAYLTASNAAADGTVDLIKASTGDVAMLPDASTLASDAAPTADAEIANKKYVDDTVAFNAFVPVTLSGKTPDATPTSNGKWNDVDLASAVSDSDARTLLLNVAFETTAHDDYAIFRANGSDADYPVAPQVGGVYVGVSTMSQQVIVACDSSQVIECKVTGGAVCKVTVAGYWR